MGSLEAIYNFVVAVLQAASYVYILEYHRVLSTTWCTKDYNTTDCHSPEGIKAVRANESGLQVILPSYGQTGTTSVVTALRELGFRAFHADDYGTLARPIMFDKIHPDTWARTVSRCRMQAISLEPVVDLLPLALYKSPKAKVIMTWRTFPAWRKSTTSTRAKEVRWGIVHKALARANMFISWIETWDRIFGTIKRERQRADPFYRNFTVAAYIYRFICNGYSWPITNVMNRGTFRSKAQEEAYLSHVNEIRTLVPKHRLLEFDVTRHSWAELESFLGLNSGRVGTPFPQPRTKDMRTNEPIMESHLHIAGWALALFVLLHALNFCLLRLVVGVFWLFAWMLGFWAPPLLGAHERWEAAMDASPVVAVLEGLEPRQAVPVAEALVAAGVRALAVPSRECGAVRSLQLLAGALPGNVALGASGVLAPGEVRDVYAAGGCFVLSLHHGGPVIRKARALGLVMLAGVWTPTEAYTALRRGAHGLCVCSGEQLALARVRACLQFAPTRWLGLEAEEAALAVVVKGGGFVVVTRLLEGGAAPDVVEKRARTVLLALKS